MVVAGALLWNHTTSIESDAVGSSKGVPVLRADEAIAAGTTGKEAFDAGAIDGAEIAREYRPDDYVSSIDEIEGSVARFDIPAGTVLSQEMFGQPGENDPIRDCLEPPYC